MPCQIHFVCLTGLTHPWCLINVLALLYDTQRTKVSEANYKDSTYPHWSSTWKANNRQLLTAFPTAGHGCHENDVVS